MYNTLNSILKEINDKILAARKMLFDDPTIITDETDLNSESLEPSMLHFFYLVKYCDYILLRFSSVYVSCSRTIKFMY